MASNIEWTGETWNPIIGCDKVSEGCANCYAIQQAYRNAAIGRSMDNPGRLANYEGVTKKLSNGSTHWTGKIVFDRSTLDIPLKRKKSQTYFVNSMSDLFHEDVSSEWIELIFDVIRSTPRHEYQILTKRPLIAIDRLSRIDIPPNVWIGVSTENQRRAIERTPLLAQINTPNRFLSVEPMLEEIDLTSIDGIDKIRWIIVGGESGSEARQCWIQWIEKIVRDCRSIGIDVFVKQLGSRPVTLSSDETYSYPIRTKGKGNNWDDVYFPDELKIRERPILAQSKDLPRNYND